MEKWVLESLQCCEKSPADDSHGTLEDHNFSRNVIMRFQREQRPAEIGLEITDITFGEVGARGLPIVCPCPDNLSWVSDGDM